MVVKEGVSLHAQQKVRFREYYSEGGKNIDLTY